MIAVCFYVQLDENDSISMVRRPHTWASFLEKELQMIHTDTNELHKDVSISYFAMRVVGKKLYRSLLTANSWHYRFHFLYKYLSLL